jgi:hypothetical protein
MKVKLLTDISDRTGVHKAGDEIEMDDALVADAVKEKLIEEVGGGSHTPSTPPPPRHTPTPPRTPETH